MTRNILDYLEKSAAAHPQKTAVIDDGRSVTYSQLLDAARRAGSHLAPLVAPGAPVGVYMEKGIDALTAFFGIVCAGGCYAMLNTELPGARLNQIQSVLQTELIITTDELRAEATELFPLAAVCTVNDLTRDPADGARLAAARDRAIDTDPLYINFTSGSTGVPKGIAVAHRSVIDFIDCFTRLFSITENDVIANQAPFDFDVSVKDIYSALSVGATLVIVPRRLFSEPVKLIDCLCDSGATTLIWAVSALCLISTFHGLEYRTPQSISKILFSGEVMPYKHLCEWQRHLPDATYVNLYGPTEITCNCTYHILQSGRDYSGGIPIGKHFPNEDVFLLGDDNKRLTERGVIGKIMVRGTALALGYYRMPDKNSDHFINNPLNSAYPELVYSTGDLGMYNADGDLVFCGRSDNQIKHMGHRIELEDIERAMSAADGVERCFCVFDKEKSRLKGFYVGSIDKSALHAVMCDAMPVYMVPGYIRKLDAIPLNKNGKIDRQSVLESMEVLQ